MCLWQTKKYKTFPSTHECALDSVPGHSAVFSGLVLANLFEPLKLYDKASPLIVLLNFRFNAFYQAKQRTSYPWFCRGHLSNPTTIPLHK